MMMPRHRGRAAASRSQPWRESLIARSPSTCLGPSDSRASRRWSLSPPLAFAPSYADASTRVPNAPDGASGTWSRRPARPRQSTQTCLPCARRRPVSVHRATGLLDEPLRRFVDRLGNRPDVMLTIHQAPRYDEHLSPATQAMLRLSQLSADCALGMAGVWLFGPGALPMSPALRSRSEPTSTSRFTAGESSRRELVLPRRACEQLASVPRRCARSARSEPNRAGPP